MTIGPLQIIIFLVIIAVLFGGKRLRNLGEDLGTSIRGFKKAMNDDKKTDAAIEEKHTKTADNVVKTVEKEDS